MNRSLVIFYQISPNLIVITLLLFVTTACGIQMPDLTPEEAIQHIFSSQPQGLELLGKRTVPAGVIVIFQKHNLDEAGQVPRFGCHLAIREGIGWDMASSTRYYIPQLDLPASFVRYSTGKRLSGTEPLLCGEVLSPPVAAVEIVLADGQTVRDQTDDGLFGVMMPPEAIFCTVRLLDELDQILHEFDLPEYREQC